MRVSHLLYELMVCIFHAVIPSFVRTAAERSRIRRFPFPDIRYSTLSLCISSSTTRSATPKGVDERLRGIEKSVAVLDDRQNRGRR
jgi:hypothetical protein